MMPAGSSVTGRGPDPVAATPSRERGIDARLLAGPLLLGLGILLLKVSNDLIVIGPFDRATFGWLIPIPMIAVSPGVAGAAARWTSRPTARRVTDLMATVLGSITYLVLATSTRQIGCDPEPGLVRIALASAPVPLVLGCCWAIAGHAAVRRADRPIVALAVGTVGAVLAGVAALMTIALMFAGASCAYVPPPA